MSKLARRLILSALSFAMISCVREEKRAGMDIIVPSTYRGWVILIMEPPSEPKRSERVEFKIPISGILETDLRIQEGWGEDRYFFDKAGQRTPIPMNMRHPATFGLMPESADGKRRTYMAVFIGDEKDWKKPGSLDERLAEVAKEVSR